MNNIELLAPAGNLEKLKMALLYGADAVYIGGERFGLRAFAGNFSIDEIKEAVEFTHNLHKKLYVTVNIIPHNDDLFGIEDYLIDLYKFGVDALIISDPGILTIAKEVVPDIELHLSTQANNTNYKSAKFWHSQGIKRIVLARELSFGEIRQIVDNTPKDIEYEAFIHGAMCVSYSGRCILSNYMVGRDSNRGACAHPCRYKYYIMEEKRPGEYFPVEEDEKGTYIFNSKDLCMIRHIPKLIESGISSLKIEGRMKSAYYVATVVRAYRMAIDSYLKSRTEYVFNEEWYNELSKASHREFTTGFYFGEAKNDGQVLHTSQYVRDYVFIGLVIDYEEETGFAIVEQRNKMVIGDEIEIIGPKTELFSQTIEVMKDKDNIDINEAPHPQQIVKIKMKNRVQKYDILRRERKEGE